jgi:hypothetical protein
MGGYSTYYTPSMYPLSIAPIPTNTLPMAGLHMSTGISYGGNQFYGIGYPLQRTPLYGEIYILTRINCITYFSLHKHLIR